MADDMVIVYPDPADLRITIRIDKDGNVSWYRDDKLHRSNGPAIKTVDGTLQWFVDGKMHRTDGPAWEGITGYKAWYFNGRRHRTDGPAIEWGTRYKAWYVNGRRHRTDGPAIDRSDGTKDWYIYGVRFSSEKEFNEYCEQTKNKRPACKSLVDAWTMADVQKFLTTPTRCPSGRVPQDRRQGAIVAHYARRRASSSRHAAFRPLSQGEQPHSARRFQAHVTWCSRARQKSALSLYKQRFRLHLFSCCFAFVSLVVKCA